MPHWHVILDGSIDVCCCITVKLNAVMPHRHVLLDCSSVLIMVWQCVPLTPGGLFHTAPLAIYLTALVVICVDCYVIILLGVSSRVCCLPADKGKGIADRSWAWRARRLYMWAGRAWIGFTLLLFTFVLLSLDDKSVERCGFITVYELVLFSNWGTPLLNIFVNEVDVFQ